MTARVLLACLIAIGSATPAFARKYYVVQNTKDPQVLRPSEEAQGEDGCAGSRRHAVQDAQRSAGGASGLEPLQNLE